MAQDSEVRVSRNGEIRTLTMRHPPRPGEPLPIEGEDWLVISVSYTVPYRIPDMSFMIRQEPEEDLQETG